MSKEGNSMTVFTESSRSIPPVDEALIEQWINVTGNTNFKQISPTDDIIMMDELEDIKYKFNIDRWGAYTLQRLHSSGDYYQNVLRYYGPWSIPTPKQRRRMLKKMRKNNDTSLDLRNFKRERMGRSMEKANEKSC